MSLEEINGQFTSTMKMEATRSSETLVTTYDK
jgi:hypothetical protein